MEPRRCPLTSIASTKPPAWIRAKFRELPDTAVILGSGLGTFAESLAPAMAVAYEAIPHWPPSRITGHAGRLVLGSAAGRRVLALSGRVHVYEGYDLEAVTFAIRVLGRLGVRSLVLTSAAGGINPRFTRGALMVLDDHINFIGANPLVGPNEDRFGPRFPDMTWCTRSGCGGLPTRRRARSGCRSNTARTSR